MLATLLQLCASASTVCDRSTVRIRLLSSMNLQEGNGGLGFRNQGVGFGSFKVRVWSLGFRV